MSSASTSSWATLLGYGTVAGSDNHPHSPSRSSSEGNEHNANRNCESENGNNDDSDVDADDAVSMDIDDAIELLGMGWFQVEILFAAGLCFAADAMEVLLLSFLTVVLEREWGLTKTQGATIVSTVFIGAMCGTLILGPLGDVIGRKPVFRVTAGILALFGIGTALVPDDGYVWLVLARICVGFGVGGLTVPFDTLAEFVPTSHRGQNLLYIEFFWTAGTLLVPVVAWLTLDTTSSSSTGLEWRSFVVWCAVPCMVSTVLGMMYVPESPRWLVTKSRNKEAVCILRQAALQNGHDDPYQLYPDGLRLTTPEMIANKNYYGSDHEGDVDGRYVVNHHYQEASLMDLFSPKWRITTLLLWGTWAGLAFLYCGVILLVSIVFSNGGTGNSGENGNDDESSSYKFDYSAIFISASSEVVGLIMVVFAIDRLGRIPIQTFAYLFGGIFSCALALMDGGPRPLLISLAFAARMCMMGATCTTWVSTSEMLSTEIRTTGHAAANAMGRIGGAISPFVISVDDATPLSTIGVIILVSSILTAAMSWNLPETAGKAMGGSILKEVESQRAKRKRRIET